MTTKVKQHTRRKSGAATLEPTVIEKESAALWELLNDKPAEGLKDAVPQAVKNYIEQFVIELSNETGDEYCSHVDIRELLPAMVRVIGAEEALMFALSIAVERIADLSGDRSGLYSSMVSAHGRLMAGAYMQKRGAQ